MKIYVIGSVNESENVIKQVAGILEKMDNEVRYVKREYGAPLESLIRKCYLNIENWADIIVVVPKCISSSGEVIIGTGTMYEMEHAKAFNKMVVIYRD